MRTHVGDIGLDHGDHGEGGGLQLVGTGRSWTVMIWTPTLVPKQALATRDAAV